uniref:GRIP domain-containing protein n=1 Tax=Mesocestoides corti TaxID=53468 RepID=A0A5K3EPH9_MESCO
MFSELHNKVSKDRDGKRPLDAHSIQSSFTAGSNESLNSIYSASGHTHRKSDRIKYLETKVSELGVLLRQKNLCLESSTKEIDRLKLELEQARSRSDGVLSEADHNRVENLQGIAEESSDLANKLTKAETDLEAVNRLSEEILAQKDEQQRKANQELDIVKHKLASSEEEVSVLRTQLTEKVVEIENLCRQLAQSSKEIEVKQKALEEAKALRLKLLSEQSAKEGSLNQLEAEKETAEKKLNELMTNFEQLKVALSRQERLTVEASDRAAVAQAEAEKARTRATSVEVRAAERESDLKDRIRLLEERLVLLTEPDAALFADHIEEAKLTTSPIPDDSSPEAASARCVTLLVERKLLETRLSETRKHLEDVKSTWNEKLSALESQITHLNEKIAEDSAEHSSSQIEWEHQRKHLESLVTELQEQCAEAQARAAKLQSDQADNERLAGEQNREWEVEKKSLLAKIAKMEQAAEAESRAHAEVLQKTQDLQSRVSALETDKENYVKEVDALKREKIELESQLDSTKAEVTQLREEYAAYQTSATESQERAKKVEQELQHLGNANNDLTTEIANLTNALEAEKEAGARHLNALNEEISKLKAQVQTSVDQISDAQKTANAAEAARRQVDSERSALQTKLVEMEKVFEAKIAEVKAKQKEDEDARTSSEVAALKAVIEELNETMSDRNKTIRLQKQKLSELKRALGQGLRPVTASNLSLISTDEEAHNHTQPFVTSNVVSPPQIVDEVTLPPLITSRQTAAPPPAPSSPPAMLPDERHDRGARQMPLSPSALLLDSQSDVDTVNFGYLRHVLLKFLLSRESEALQLVRAVATILRLSKEDEFLIRQKLEQRRSWFAAPVVSPKATGQFSKVVSP